MNLAFTSVVAEDNSKITITDTTPDWEVGGIQDVYDNGTATLTMTILGVAYDAIDVSSYFDGGSQSTLVFIITPELLKISGVSQFSGDVPDGDWVISYQVTHTIGGGQSDTYADTEYLYGIVEEGVQDEMLITNLNDWQFDNTLQEALLVGAHNTYLEGLKKAAEEEDTTNFRTALANLEIMLENGNY
jgi:hypothetical protein